MPCYDSIMNYYQIHQELLDQVMIELQKKYPNGRFFSRAVGLFYTKNGSPVKVGYPGQADIWGIDQSRHFEIEIKTGQARQSKSQKKWQKICDELGIIYKVIRSTKDVWALP